MIDILAALIIGGIAGVAILMGGAVWLFHWLLEIPDE